MVKASKRTFGLALVLTAFLGFVIGFAVWYRGAAVTKTSNTPMSAIGEDVQFLQNGLVDLGIIRSGESAECELKVVNGTRNDVTIDLLRVSCGCSRVQPAAVTIAPNSSSSFKCTVGPVSSPFGPHEVLATFGRNGSDERYEVHVKYKSVDRMWLEPGSAIVSGDDPRSGNIDVVIKTWGDISPSAELQIFEGESELKYETIRRQSSPGEWAIKCHLDTEHSPNHHRRIEFVLIDLGITTRRNYTVYVRESTASNKKSTRVTPTSVAVGGIKVFDSCQVVLWRESGWSDVTIETTGCLRRCVAKLVPDPTNLQRAEISIDMSKNESTGYFSGFLLVRSKSLNEVSAVTVSGRLLTD